MNKLGQKKVSPVVWIVLAVLVYGLNIGGIQAPINNFLGSLTGAAPPVAPGAPDGLCIYDGTTMTVGPMKQKYTPGTSMTDEAARLYVNGVDKGLKMEASEQSVTVGDEVELYYAENSTNYYAAKHAFTVPCAATFSSGDEKVDPELRHQVYEMNDGANFTVTVTNEDGTINSGAANEALGAGDVDTLEVDIKGTFEDALSPYGKALVICNLNSTAYDDLTITGEGATRFSGSVPSQVLSTRSSTDMMRGYEVPALDGSTKKKLELQFVIDADDTIEPTNGGEEAGNISCHIFDQDWYQNSDTGKMEYDYWDNDDANVGITGDDNFSISIT